MLPILAERTGNGIPLLSVPITLAMAAPRLAETAGGWRCSDAAAR